MQDDEDIYRQILDHINEIVYQVDGDPLAGRVRFVSKQVEEILGYRPEEFTQSSSLWFQIIHPDDVFGLTASTQQIIATRVQGLRVYRLRHKNRGEYLWFEDKVVPQVDAQGRVTGIWGVARDITARRRHEAELLKLQERYHRLIEQAPVGITENILDGSQPYINPCGREILGYGEDLSGFSIQHLYVNIEDRRALLENLERQGVYSHEFQVRRKDGVIISTKGISWFLRDDQGKPLSFQTIFQDITREKRQEQQRLAVDRVRERVWRMQSTQDILRVLEEIKAGMVLLGISFKDCDINLMDHTTDPPLVRYYALTRENSQWEKAGEGWRKTVVDMWRGGVVDYRPDLLEEDPYQEREHIEAVYHHLVRSVIDVPFSHGTLGVNSDLANAFSSQDIAFLEELTRVLSEGFQRMRDLECLAQSEARYRSLVETPEFVVVLLDPQGRYLYVSPQIEPWTGYPPEAFYADHTQSLARKFIHPDDYSEVDKLFQQFLRDRAPVKIEYRWRRKNGGSRWVSENIYPVRDASGEVTTFQIIVQDIDARRQMEEALQQSSAQYQAILATTTDGFWVVDAQGRILEVNDSYCQLIGYSRRELLQMSVSHVETAETSEDIARHIQKVIESGTDRFETRHRAKGGRIIDIEVSVTFVSRLNGFLSFMRDITARKKAEKALHEANTLLERQVRFLEQLYQLRVRLAESRTPDQIITCVGQALVEMGERIAPLELVIEYHDGKTWHFGKVPEGAFTVYERALTWRGQGRGQLRLRCASPLCMLEEQMLLEEVVAQLAQALEACEVELQLLQSSRLVSLGQMAAGVAHELYQPLTAISATAEDIYLRLLDNLELPSPQLREMMKDVLGVVERMGEVIEQLRAFSRDTPQEPGSRFSLNAVVQGALQLIRAQLQSHDIQVVLALGADLPQVEGHLHQLEQVVLNLLANAHDALDERQEGDTKQVVVRTYAQEEQVVLEVEDNGVGMAEEVRLRVFEPFFTTKQVDRGTGLGLSISYGIVRNHQGQITCDSRKGQGTTFQITLPAAGQG